MTNHHVLNEKDIGPGQTINFSINNDYKEYNVLIDNNRKTYTDEYYDKANYKNINNLMMLQLLKLKKRID